MVRIRVRRENFMGADCSTGGRLGIGWGESSDLGDCRSDGWRMGWDGRG